MQGRIIKFHQSLNVGVIKTPEGQKIRFGSDQVINPNGRFVGHEVDFVAPQPGHLPKDIILLTGSIWSVFAEPSNEASELHSRKDA
jgi:hypothetical protein